MAESTDDVPFTRHLPCLLLSPHDPIDATIDESHEDTTVVKMFPLKPDDDTEGAGDLVVKGVHLSKYLFEEVEYAGDIFHTFGGGSRRARSNIIAVRVTLTPEGKRVHVAPSVTELEPLHDANKLDSSSFDQIRHGGLFDLWMVTATVEDIPPSDTAHADAPTYTLTDPHTFVAYNIRVVNDPADTTDPLYVDPNVRAVVGVTTDDSPETIMAGLKDLLYQEPGGDDDDDDDDSDGSNAAPGVPNSSDEEYDDM